MFRASALLGTAILGVAFLVGSGSSQDNAKSSGKARTYLPVGWKALGLSQEQTSKISTIHANYKAKMKELEDQIKDMKSKERKEMVTVLTPDQKTKLQKLALGEDGGATTNSSTTKSKSKSKSKDN